jgi:hypothetical protein
LPHISPGSVPPTFNSSRGPPRCTCTSSRVCLAPLSRQGLLCLAVSLSRRLGAEAARQRGAEGNPHVRSRRSGTVKAWGRNICRLTGRAAGRIHVTVFDGRPGLAGPVEPLWRVGYCGTQFDTCNKGLKMSVRSSVVPGCLALAILVAAASQSHAEWAGICSCKSDACHGRWQLKASNVRDLHNQCQKNG